MSPRRKSGLSPEDLQALKHLPAVIRALENLQEQHAKVRALMGEPRGVSTAKGRIVLPVGLENAEAERLAYAGNVSMQAPTANLVTDERREYEAAKKAGKEVPPGLASISEAQRERMAEQRALVQQMRRAKGLPVTGEVEPVTEDQVVRTEELPTSESGSVGGEEDPEAR